jgi:arylsulfatase A-like enzyme/tetratricopeptide (TPR) repeat protein
VESGIALQGLRDSGKPGNIDPAGTDSKHSGRADAARRRAPRRTQPSAAELRVGALACRLSWVVLLAAALACGRPAERVVLVSIDTLRADHLGCYGADFAHTPRLDALAAGGVRFATAISPVPLTLPSHTTLLTGLDPPEHGVRHNGVFRLAEDVPTLAERMREAGFATAAFVASYVLDRQFGLARGFDRYDDRTSRQQSGRGILGFAERPADQVVDAALEWLGSAPPRFFLWVHLYDPHSEYRPPPGFASAFPNRPYDGEIAFADAQVGRLLGALGERFPDGGTLVVVTADHGESLGEHGEATHSHLVYDATQHVPLLMNGPGLSPGRVVDPVVSLRDVAPTILDLAGVPPLPGATGRSLAAAARGRALEPRAAHVETLATQLDWGWSPLLGLRTEGFKYVRAPRPELYDVAADPGETRNLLADQPERAAALDAELERRLASARPVAPNVELPDEGRERLEALGYVVPADLAARPDLGVVGGRDPKDGMEALAVVYAADRLVGEQKPTEAVAKLLALPMENVVYQGLLATAALAAGDPALAERAARNAIRAAPLLRVGWARLAQALEAQERWDEAAEAYAVMAERDPRSGEVQTSLGRLAERAGALEVAADRYRRAGAAERPDPSAAWQLAALEIEAGRTDAADALLGEAAPEALAEPGAALRLARAERKVGRPERAVGWLDAALRESPGWVELRVARADALEDLEGRAEEARAERETALAAIDGDISEFDPAVRARLLWLRSRVLEDLGRREEASRSVMEALSRPELLAVDARRDARALAARVGADGIGRAAAQP